MLTVLVASLSVGMVANAQGDYIVKKGDNLSKIVGEQYGDSSKWKTIYEANKETIKDPNLIFIGQSLAVPGAAVETPAVVEEIPTAVEPVITEEAPAAASAGQQWIDGLYAVTMAEDYDAAIAYIGDAWKSAYDAVVANCADHWIDLLGQIGICSMHPQGEEGVWESGGELTWADDWSE